MYQINDYIVYERNGVCKIENIGSLNFSTASKKDYYTLRPVFSQGHSVIYVPTDTKAFFRAVISRQEALDYINTFHTLMPKISRSVKPPQLINHYSNLLNSNDIITYLSMLKEIQLKRDILEKKGKELGQTDVNYLKKIEQIIFEEFSFSLQLSIEEIKTLFECKTQLIIN